MKIRKSAFAVGGRPRSHSLIYSAYEILDGIIGLLSLGTRTGEYKWEYLMKNCGIEPKADFKWENRNGS